jgi:hypothetical protein
MRVSPPYGDSPEARLKSDATSTFTGETAAGYSIARIESIPKND